jgi:hypothetical protein
MAEESGIDLEDLARRYDAQVLREYLLEQGETTTRTAQAAASLDISQRASTPEVFELRPRTLGRLRVLLVLNVLIYWTIVGYCTYAYYIRVVEVGARALPQLEVSLLGFFALGTQSTVEFAVVACLTHRLTQPSLPNDTRSVLRARDGAAWLAGLGARTALLLDALCLPLMWRGSSLLFLLSATVFFFAIGIFVCLVQIRLLFGIYCERDHFSYDKPDLFFKGRDLYNGATEGPRIAAPPPVVPDDEDPLDSARASRPVPHPAIKAANLAHLSDLSMLHAVLARLYIPIGCQETQEFISSATSFSRCFCEDVVQCSLKFFFLMDCELNLLVLFSLLISSGQAIAMCLYATTSAMDIRADEDAND